MASSAVPVACNGLGIEADDDVELLSYTTEDPPGHPQVISHLDTLAGSNLVLPLSKQIVRSPFTIATDIYHSNHCIATTA